MTAALGPGVKAVIVKHPDARDTAFIGRVVTILEEVVGVDLLKIYLASPFAPNDRWFRVSFVGEQPELPAGYSWWAVPGKALRPLGGEGLGSWDEIHKVTRWHPVRRPHWTSERPSEKERTRGP